MQTREPISIVPLSSPPTKIMGEGKIPHQWLAKYLLQQNPAINRKFVLRLAFFYVEEARIEGVNSDIAFMQMCLETGYLKDTPHVLRNNFAGIGVVTHGIPGHAFATARMGVRAQIQHLKAYASKEPLKKKLIDPRFQLVTRASAPTIFDLTKKWATDPMYGQKIYTRLEELYQYVQENSSSSSMR